MELFRKLRNLRNTSGNAVSADSLPARDFSWEAHKVLISCVLVQGVLEGLPLCFGIFQNHYQHYLFPGYQNSSWIGDTAIGLMWLGAPLMSYLVEERHMKPERFIFAAWGLCVVSLIGTAFCRTIPTLAVTQGALLGLSVLLMEMPGLIILNSWFVERRGFAYGILFAFNDVFGTFWAYLGRYVLQVYDLKITMLVFAAIAATLPAFFIWTFKSRPVTSTLPGSTTGDEQDAVVSLGQQSQSAANPNRKFYMRPLFWFLILTSCAQSFAFYVPSIYLPTYNMQVIARITDCTLENTNLLAVFNLAQIPGEFVFGWLSDRMNSHTLAVASCLMPCIVTILLWLGVVGDISATFGSLLVFAAVFGAFGAGFGSLWGRMSMGFGLKQSQMVFALMSLARGLSTVASAPVSSALIGGEGGAHNTSIETALIQLGLQSPYGALILFVGCCMGVAALAAAAGWVANRMDEKKEIGRQ
ncbi:hypothetical protein AMS68_005977 [Peltaster fructicola]|uniref:Major facilitator superfamily (MFS) profile domain-containing protein n=1 Tax=Peltaster fructicola TaxID=286661 RepID=A0A6H0Y1D1_9PEZI|nr:hypothetical protein AMS68_005977 [Peltaster fructicola]